MVRHWVSGLFALAGFMTLALALPAQANNERLFHTPSGNIKCDILAGDAITAMCQISGYTPSFPKPADCRGNYGDVFIIEHTGKAYLPCGASVLNANDRYELPYDHAVGLGSVMCLVEKTGITCKNKEGHGFFVSRKSQKVW